MNMSEIFNRNVHPLYAVMAFVAATIVLILYLYSAINNRTKERDAHLNFFGYIIFFCIQDAIWGLFASGVINSDVGLMISSAVFHASSALAPFVWSVYYNSSMNKYIRRSKIVVYYSATLMLVQFGMIICNFFTKFMFYVDETGNYQTTDFRSILFYLQFSVYILTTSIAIFGLATAKGTAKQRGIRSFILISLGPVVFDIFQLIYPDAPASSMGLCISCVLVQTFLTQSFELQVRELQAEAELQEVRKKEYLASGVITTLSLEYGPLYLTDLQTGELQVFRTSDMPCAFSIQQLANECGDFNKFRTIYAETYVIESDRKAFLRWTEIGHLNGIITTENITEFNYQRIKDGVQNYYQFCCGRVPGSDNLMVFGFRNVDTMVKKDIETKKALEEALKEANVANEAKTRFLFNMSHDIRTPMNAILGFTELTKKNLGNAEKVNDYLNKLDDAGHHLLELINEILDMSRIESGKMTLRIKPMNLTKASTTTMEICTEAGRQHDVTVELHRGKAGALWVYGDETRINQIAMNIISNAIKYTNPGGRVDIWVKILDLDKSNNTVSLELLVKDTGIGMSKEFLAKLYDPFERSESSTVSGIQGTGLGMTIVKQLVEMMHGTIDVKSELGVGTEVSIIFKFRLAKPEDEEQPDEQKPTLKSIEGIKILLVEDNMLNREIACEILEEKGVIVEAVEDGDIAVEKMQNAKDGQYDIILMDVQMPRMNGYDATRAIRKLPNAYAANIPIIAMTANAFDEDKQNAFDAGMNGHLSKPIETDKLFAVLSETIK